MKLPLIAFGAVVAAATAGAAIAANEKTHRLDVPLPGGGVVQIQYVGDIAPKVSLVANEAPGFWAPAALPGLGDFGGLFEQMDRQMRQIQQMASAPGAPGMNVAAYGDMPQGSSSVTVVSTSNGAGTCTRTTEVVAQGAGRPPKVTNKLSGNCADGQQSAPQAEPSSSSGSIDHT